MKKGKGKYVRLKITGMKEIFRPMQIRNDRGDWDLDKIENLFSHLAAALPNDIEELFNNAIMRAGIHAGRTKATGTSSRYIMESNHMEEVRSEMLHLRDKRCKRIPSKLSASHGKAPVQSLSVGHQQRDSSLCWPS